MGWQDRSYYRDGNSGTGNPLMWVLAGSVPLFTVFGIRVRAHASLVLLIVLVLLFGLGQGYTWQDRVQSMGVLFCIVLLHEFGHCFAARWVGGDATDILMSPLGGLAYASPPHRPLATFITVAAGPMVNVVICALTAGVTWLLTDKLFANPFYFQSEGAFRGWLSVYSYAAWIYQISWLLLMFNLLPIFPLDGGRLVQTMLWPKFGYYKSMLFACITGMVGAVIGGMIALATLSILLLSLAISGFITCYSMRQQVLAAGPYGFTDEIDYGYGGSSSPNRRRKVNRRVARRAEKAERVEQIERSKIDAILAKVSAKGMHTLTWWEKRTLRRATERQRKADGARRVRPSRAG